MLPSCELMTLLRLHFHESDCNIGRFRLTIFKESDVTQLVKKKKTISDWPRHEKVNWSNPKGMSISNWSTCT